MNITHNFIRQKERFLSDFDRDFEHSLMTYLNMFPRLRSFMQKNYMYVCSEMTDKNGRFTIVRKIVTCRLYHKPLRT